MNVHNLTEKAELSRTIHECLETAVSAAVGDMSDAQVMSMLKSPLQEFEMAEEKLAA